MSKYEPFSLDTITPSKWEGLETKGQLPFTEMHDSHGDSYQVGVTDGK